MRRAGGWNWGAFRTAGAGGPADLRPLPTRRQAGAMARQSERWLLSGESQVLEVTAERAGPPTRKRGDGAFGPPGRPRQCGRRPGTRAYIRPTAGGARRGDRPGAGPGTLAYANRRWVMPGRASARCLCGSTLMCF